jgi:hypothetical protein
MLSVIAVLFAIVQSTRIYRRRPSTRNAGSRRGVSTAGINDVAVKHVDCGEVSGSQALPRGSAHMSHPGASPATSQLPE